MTNSGINAQILKIWSRKQLKMMNVKNVEFFMILIFRIFAIFQKLFQRVRQNFLDFFNFEKFLDPGPIRYIFYDAETTQETGKHIANLIVAHAICNYCLDSNRPFEEEPDSQNPKCVCPNEKRKVFENFDGFELSPTQQFLDWCGQREKKKFKSIALAHNGSR